MAVNHMVWLRFKPDLSEERVAQHLAALRLLAERVPGISGLTLGANFTDRANGFTHALSVLLENKAALTAYATHPAHVEVASALRQDADIMALDYEY
jgi:hypothetical protein